MGAADRPLLPPAVDAVLNMTLAINTATMGNDDQWCADGFEPAHLCLLLFERAAKVALSKLPPRFR